MLFNPLISKVTPIILRRAKQPFGQIDITLRNAGGERGMAVHKRSTTIAVQKKNKKLNSPERKYFILQQPFDFGLSIVVQTKFQLMRLYILNIH